MTFPPPNAQPPETIGTNPPNASAVNGLVGTHLRAFLIAKATVHQDQDFFAASDLKVAPYYFTAEQETQIKTAVSGLDSALQAIDLTFINRVVGMWGG